MTPPAVAALAAVVLVVVALFPKLRRGRPTPRARALVADGRATPRTQGVVARGRATARMEGVVRRGSAEVGARGRATPHAGGLMAGGRAVARMHGVVARRRAEARLRRVRTEAAPAMIDLLGACLRAGLNPYLAICRLVERSPDALRAELDRAVVDLRLGRSPGAALQAVAERTGLDEFRAAAAALEAADRWGMAPAEALAARAEALRSRRRLEAEAEAGRAAVRLAFPLVLCFLPAFALVVVVPTVAGAVRALVP
jgi:uncharacterized membrane protein YqiK